MISSANLTGVGFSNVKSIITAHDKGVDLKPHAAVVSDILLDRGSAALYNADGDGETKNLQKLKTIISEIDDSGELAQELLTQNCSHFANCAGWHTERAKLIAEIALKADPGGDTLRTLLLANNSAALITAVYQCNIASIDAIRSMAVSVNILPQLLKNAEKSDYLKNSIFASTNLKTYADVIRSVKSLVAEGKAGKTIVSYLLASNDCYIYKQNFSAEHTYYLLADEFTPLEARKKVDSPTPTTGWLSQVEMPTRDNYGALGQVYEYGAALAVSWKLHELQKVLEHNDINLEKVVANHSYNGKKVYADDKVQWTPLHKATEHVTYKQIAQVGDSISEISNYVAMNLLAARYVDKGKLHKLKNLTPEVEEELAALRNQVTKYFIEEKNLPQMMQSSNQWHRWRHNLINISPDQSTLRDFSATGEWHQTLPEKELKVTIKGLEEYSIVNLTNAIELDEEGKILDHCVPSYVENCKKGYQVFSIRKNGEAQTTMGFNLVDGELQLHQNYGYKNREVNSDEKAIQDWFIKGVKSEEIKLNLGRTGEIPVISERSEFENRMGIEFKNMTTDRLNSNLSRICSIKRGQNYIFGEENKTADTGSFRDNMNKKTPDKSEPPRSNFIAEAYATIKNLILGR